MSSSQLQDAKVKVLTKKMQPAILSSCTLQHEKMYCEIHRHGFPLLSWGAIEIPFTSLGKTVSVACL